MEIHGVWIRTKAGVKASGTHNFLGFKTQEFVIYKRAIEALRVLGHKS